MNWLVFKVKRKKYFHSKKLPLDILLKIAQCAQSISNYYTSHDHNAEKSHKVLNFTQNLIIEHLNEKSILKKLDLTSISDDRLFVELKQIKHLPELYTQLLYCMGRVTIYNHFEDINGELTTLEAIDKAEKIFDTVEKLGKKLNMFDSVSAYTNGIGVLNNQKVIIKYQEYKKTKNAQILDEIKQLLQSNIDFYEQSYKDDNVYKIGYCFNGYFSEKSPATNIRHIIQCKSSLVKYYLKMAVIDKDNNENYINKIVECLSNDKGSDSLLSLIRKDDIADRSPIAAMLDLGFALNRLNDNGIDVTKITSKIDANKTTKEIILNLFHEAYNRSTLDSHVHIKAAGAIVQLSEKFEVDEQNKKIMEKEISDLSEYINLNYEDETILVGACDAPQEVDLN